jgi:hypothetical protein
MIKWIGVDNGWKKPRKTQQETREDPSHPREGLGEKGEEGGKPQQRRKFSEKMSEKRAINGRCAGFVQLILESKL